MSFENMSTGMLKARMADLKAASTATGKRRMITLASLNEIKKELAFTVRYDRHITAIRGDGQPYSDANVAEEGDKAKASLVRIAEDLRHPSLVSQLPGAAWANKSFGKLIIPAGVCLIVGGGGVGKTPLAHALAGHEVDTYSVVRIGEPLSGYTSSNQKSAESFAQALYANSDVVLDSIKDLLSSGSGAAMKSGISRDALSGLSAWSSLACDLGVTVYVPVNPSTKDPEVIELLAEAARSNATMTIVHDQGPKWNFWSRQGEGLDRNTGTLLLTFRDGVARVSVDGQAVTQVSEQAAGLAISSRVSDWDSVTRRALSPTSSND